MDEAVNYDRRRFLAEFLRGKVVRPLVHAHDQMREEARRERFETAYEAELRAFGPDILVDAARRSGIAAEGDVDYARVAKTLADAMASQDDGSQ